VLLLPALALAHVPFDVGHTTITELNPASAAEGGQWFEVRNNTASTQNLVEQVFTDTDGDTFAVAFTVLVRSGEHVVFASEDSTIDADYRFPAAFDVRADAGAVVHTDLGTTVDDVRWDAAWGMSGVWQVTEPLAANSWANDLPTNWCAAAPETPGEPNLPCPGADTDADADGYTPADGDCDDTDPTVFPGAPDGPEPANDGDCDGTRDEDPPAEPDTGGGGDTGGDTGVDTGADTGADTSADTSADTGVDTGIDTGVDSGVDSGGDTGWGDTAATDTGRAGTDTGAPDPACGCVTTGAAGGLPGLILAAGLARRRGRRERAVG